MSHFMKGLTRGLVALLVGLTGALAPAFAPSGEAATTLPGGKPSWVVAVGGIQPSAQNNFRNWVRLGYYTFKTDGTVYHSWWTWQQRNSPQRIDTVQGDCGGAVPNCKVKTVAGFTGEINGSYTGTYSYDSAGRLVVTFTASSGSTLSTPLTEKWNLKTGLNGNTLARMTSPSFNSSDLSNTALGATPRVPAPGEFSSYSATFGVGYGSTASLDSSTRASMRQLLTDSRYNNRDYRGLFITTTPDPTKTTSVLDAQATGGNWTFSGGSPTDTADAPWRLNSTGSAIGYLQTSANCSGGCGSFGHITGRVRYIAEIGGGRRNTEWYWCKCLAQGAACYQANSHPRPMLQIVDDAGVFQGWVGVEAFTHVNTSTLNPDQRYAEEYYGVFNMVPSALR